MFQHHNSANEQTQVSQVQTTFSGSSTDGSFTTTISNLFLSPQQTKKNPTAADITVFVLIAGEFLFYIDNDILCVLIRIAWMRRF